MRARSARICSSTKRRASPAPAPLRSSRYRPRYSSGHQASLVAVRRAIVSGRSFRLDPRLAFPKAWACRLSWAAKSGSEARRSRRRRDIFAPRRAFARGSVFRNLLEHGSQRLALKPLDRPQSRQPAAALAALAARLQRRHTPLLLVADSGPLQRPHDVGRRSATRCQRRRCLSGLDVAALTAFFPGRRSSL